MNSVLFHCTCCKPFSSLKSPSSNSILSSFYHKELKKLLFCEECDSIRCDECVLNEISCYYCPNCLFEVPSASVRGEKNRCARNCFQCPQCTHTLSVVATDPDPSIPLNPAAASSGEPPYYLNCNFCRWDSKEVGIVFEKPTGLAHQLQKGEDNSPDILEFDHLKEHLEPYIRRSQAQAQAQAQASTSSHPTSSSSLLSSSISHNPSSSRYTGTLFGLNHRPRGGIPGGNKGMSDELEEYKSLNNANGIGKGKMIDRDSEMVKELKELTDINQIASLDKRWNESFGSSILSSSLKPLRTLLHSKLSKRCPTCKHILIKPEQKSSSTRFKIKLMASNYLPDIEIFKRPPASSSSMLGSSRLSSIGGASTSSRSGGIGSSGRGNNSGRMGVGISNIDDEPLRPGRTYTFELSFINPLYEPIHVRLAVARPSPNSNSTTTTQLEEGQMPPPVTYPYAVNLPTNSFSIKAHAEEWEYEDDDNNGMSGVEDLDEQQEDLLASPSKKRKGGSGNAGIVERKMNRTTIIMEVAVGKETVGVIKANMLVTYIYQSDEVPLPSTTASSTKSPTKKLSEKEDMKKFSFWTLLTLGTVKESSRRLAQASTMSTASSN